MDAYLITTIDGQTFTVHAADIASALYIWRQSYAVGTGKYSIDDVASVAPASRSDGVFLTREQLEAWTGYPLTDEEISRLDECIPHSSIPDAVSTIVDSLRDEWSAV